MAHKLSCLRVLGNTTYTETHVWDGAVEPVRTITAESIGKVAHHVAGELHISELLLGQPIAVAALAWNLLAGRMDICLGRALETETAVADPTSYNRSEPLAEIYVESRRDTVNQLALLVVVTENQLTTALQTDEPVRTRRSGLNTEFVSIISYRLGGVTLDLHLRLCGCTECQCQQHRH